MQLNEYNQTNWAREPGPLLPGPDADLAPRRPADRAGRLLLCVGCLVAGVLTGYEVDSRLHAARSSASYHSPPDTAGGGGGAAMPPGLRLAAAKAALLKGEGSEDEPLSAIEDADGAPWEEERKQAEERVLRRFGPDGTGFRPGDSNGT
eukprot:SAG22_NODE_3459_length_1699_cov_1.450625_1_plen_148_part_10